MERKNSVGAKDRIFYGYFGNLRGMWMMEHEPELFKALVESDELDDYLESYQKSFSLKSQRLFQKYEDEYGLTESMHDTNFLEFIRREMKISQKVKEILEDEIQR